MRLKAEIWIKAYIRRCAAAGAAAVVVRHGDDDAGAIFIRVSRLDGTTQHLEVVESAVPLLLRDGITQRQETSFCQAILDGKLPPVIPDITAYPAARSLPAARLPGIRSYVSVPVVLSDGSSASVVPLSLTSAPAGEAYWLWGTGGASGSPVALGKVTVGDGAAADLQLQDSAQPAGFSGYALSVESDTGVPVSPSTVIGSSGTI